MKFTELGIVTRREAPARARARGEAFLVRAGYLTQDHELTRLGQLSISRLRASPTPLTDIFAQTSLPVLQLEGGKIGFAAASGEVDVLRCPACGYADETDLARAGKVPLPAEPPLSIRKVATPHCNTIEALAAFLGVGQERTAKAMMYTRSSDDKFVFVVVRGDMQVSERKLGALVGAVRPATVDEMFKAGAVAGYASPIGLQDALVVVDDLIPQSANLAVGANEEGFHLLNANYGTDFGAQIVDDVTLARPGDPCPRCGTHLTSLTARMLVDATGLLRANVLLAFAEAFHDDKGLRLPRHVAPFDVYLVQLSSKQMDIQGPSEALCRDLEASDVSVLCDDRDDRAGVKFNDADLIGCPVRLTVGERNLREGMVELKRRDKDQIHTVKLTEATDQVLALLRDANA